MQITQYRRGRIQVEAANEVLTLAAIVRVAREGITDEGGGGGRAGEREGGGGEAWVVEDSLR